MSLAPYLTLISEVLPMQRRDFYVEDPTLLNPLNANPLLDGEFLEINANYKLARGSSEQAKPAWQVWAERGRYDTQAIGKTTVLFIGGYEAETSVYTSTGLAVGDALVIDDVTVGGVAGKRGVVKLGVGSGQHMVYGYVTRILTGRVRFFVAAAGGGWKTV